MKIGVDFGHTKYSNSPDYGAVGIRPESDLTREIGSKVIAKLQSLGHTVVNCTCDNASSLSESLAYRVNMANNNKVDLFICIHFNCFNGQAHGTEVFTYNAKQTEKAKNILNNIVALGYTNRGIKDGSNLYVVRNTIMESMLIECCFCDNKDDMAKFNSESMANAIVKGITGQLPKENNTNSNVNQDKPSQKVTYDITRPTGDNIYPIGKHSYIEETADGRTILHNDRGNYIAIGKGFIDLFWNDGNGKNGSKRISG